ncbi:MAG: ribosome-binding factor A [Candidatus Nealsonbacteria bacterium]
MERIPKVNQLVKKELSQIILRHVEFPKGVLVTVTRADTSRNLIQSKISISVMPEGRRAEVIGVLNRSIYDIQQHLNKRLHMRPMPKIIFIEEKETAEAGHVEELLEKIKYDKSN